MQLSSRLRHHAKASPENVSWSSASRRSEGAKLLRGQGFPDMSDFDSKVANYYGKSYLEPLQIRKLLRDRPKFLAVQRHTF
jgi:hypothetical protein